MHSIITSYLLQTNKCALSHFGVFNAEYKRAKTDIVNNQLVAPSEIIVFKEEDLPSSAELIHFISVKKNISEGEAESQLDIFCKEWREKIETRETLCFDAFGSLKKNEEGNIVFIKATNHAYFRSISSRRVLHENAQHNVLVGDNETTSTIMNRYYSKEVEVTKLSWPKWMLIFTAIALSVLFYHFYNHKFSTSSTGNQSHFVINAAPQTHFELSK